MWCERRSPPCGKAVTRPSTRQARAQRTALDTAMPKRAAAALQERPPSTAAITRERKSWDKARVIHAGLLPSMYGESHRAALGKDFLNRSGRFVLYPRSDRQRPPLRRRHDGIGTGAYRRRPSAHLQPGSGFLVAPRAAAASPPKRSARRLEGDSHA